jgi:hypothetical protein
VAAHDQADPEGHEMGKAVIAVAFALAVLLVLALFWQYLIWLP